MKFSIGLAWVSFRWSGYISLDDFFAEIDLQRLVYMLTDEDKKYILKQHLINIHHISDKEYQKRVWVRGEGPECDDFTETVCHFFDDGDPILKRYRDFGIVEKQYYILKKFREEFEKFADQNDWPPEFMDTPEWSKITEMANEVLKAFNYSKTIS